MHQLLVRISALKFVLSLASVALALRLFGTEKLLRILPASGPIAAPENVAQRVAAGVSYASAKVPSATCLPQALLARFILGRRGYHAAIHIGVRTADGELAAHAWTVSGDTIVSGGPRESLVDFKPIRILD
jgi:hypothetical protein